MVSVQIAALVVALSSGGDTVLLDFNATWCAPCRSMDGTVAELQHAGYPVRKVDIDRERSAGQSVPRARAFPASCCWSTVMKSGRITGASRRSELLALFAKGGVKPQRTDGAIARAQSPDTSGAPVQRPRAADPFTRRARSHDAGAASSRRRRRSIRRTWSPRACGSRSTIRNRRVVRFGHDHRLARRRGLGAHLRPHFSRFAGQGPHHGRLVRLADGGRRCRDGWSAIDLDRDLGLVSIRPGGPVRVAPVAPKGQPLARGDQVVSVGCNNGKAATAVPSRITAIDKFLGSPNLQVAGLPVEGRSGGGLFTADGQVIGVCNAADPTDNEGLYAALAAIHTQLDEAGLTAIYTHPAKTIASEVAAAGAPAMPASMPPARLPTPSAMRETASPQGAAIAAAALNDAQRAAIAQLQKQDDNAEVICIVRSLGNPQAKSEVIMFDHASAALLKQLAVDRDAQSARHLTSLEVPAREPAVRLGTQPSGRPLRELSSTHGRIAPNSPLPRARRRGTLGETIEGAMKLFCVRHGETFFNLAGRIQGQSDSQLSPLGRRQCQAVAAALAGTPIDAVISSPLTRALESAQCVADALGVKVLVDDRLMEINAGIFQGLTWSEIDERYPQESLQLAEPGSRLSHSRGRVAPRRDAARARGVFARSARPATVRRSWWPTADRCRPRSKPFWKYPPGAIRSRSPIARSAPPAGTAISSC